jgi:hypothetical protein
MPPGLKEGIARCAALFRHSRLHPPRSTAKNDLVPTPPKKWYSAAIWFSLATL